MHYSQSANTLGDPDRRRALPPELALATAVIEQAVADLAGPLELARPAALWLMSDSLHAYSARSLCDTLGIPHSRLVSHAQSTWWRYQRTDWREAPTETRGQGTSAIPRKQFMDFSDRGMTRLDVMAETGVTSREITRCINNYKIDLRPVRDVSDVPDATWRKLEPLLRRLVDQRQQVTTIARAIGMHQVPVESLLERMTSIGIHVPYAQQSREASMLREAYRMTGSIAAAARAACISVTSAEERLRNVPRPATLHRIERITPELLEKWRAFHFRTEQVAAFFGLRFLDVRAAEREHGIELPAKHHRYWKLIEPELRAFLDAGNSFEDLVRTYEIPTTSHKRLRVSLRPRGARR